MTFIDAAQQDNPQILLDCGASTAKDYSGYSNAVVNDSAVTFIPVIFGGEESVVVSSGDQLTVSSVEHLWPMSVEAWFREYSQGTTAIASSDDTDLLILDDQQIKFVVNYPSGAVEAVHDIIDGRTYHVVGSISPDRIALYVNGELADSVDTPIDESPTFGTELVSGAGTGSIAIDGVALYRYELSEETILEHFLAGSPDFPMSESVSAARGAALLLTDETADVVEIHDFPEESDFEDAIMLGLEIIDDALVPEEDDLGDSIEGYAIYQFPLEGLNTETLGAAKIEWEAIGSWNVECSLDGETWTACANDSRIPVITDDFVPAEESLFIKVEYPEGLAEDAVFMSMRIALYSTRLLNPTTGGRSVFYVGDVVPADQERDFIEQAFDTGINITNGYAYLDYEDESEATGLRTIELTAFIPEGDFTLVESEDGSFSVSVSGGVWTVDGADAVTNGVAGMTPEVGVWNHLAFILDDVVTDTNIITNSQMTSAEDDVLIITNLYENASFETGIHDVVTNGGTAAEVVASETADSGQNVLRLIRETPNSDDLIATLFPIVLDAASSVSARLKVRLAPGASPDLNMTAQIFCFNGSTPLSAASGQIVTAPTVLDDEEWSEILIEGGTTVASTTQVGIRLNATGLTAANWLDDDGIEIDSVLVVESASAPEFFYEETVHEATRQEETGTPGASTVERRGDKSAGWIAYGGVGYTTGENSVVVIADGSQNARFGVYRSSSSDGITEYIQQNETRYVSFEVEPLNFEEYDEVRLYVWNPTGGGTAITGGAMVQPYVEGQTRYTFEVTPDLQDATRLYFAIGNSVAADIGKPWQEVRIGNVVVSDTPVGFFSGDSPGAFWNGTEGDSSSSIYGPQDKVYIGTDNTPANMAGLRVGYLVHYADKLTVAEIASLYGSYIGRTGLSHTDTAITGVTDSPVSPDFYAHDWSFTGAG